MKRIYINNRPIGRLAPCYIIAEAGVNHNGSVEQALLLVDAAAAAGADAVKFQSFTAANLVGLSAPKADYQKVCANTGESQFEMLRRLELSVAEHGRIFERARQWGIEFISTPFDEVWADNLANMGVNAFKIGSGELTNLPLLRHVAEKGKPLIISTGMADLPEVEQALATVRAAGAREIILLQCTSAYPAPPESVNLKAMRTLKRKCGVLTGLSDHTAGIEIAVGAAAFGAAVIEKHFTLNRNLPGPDHRMSLEPEELAGMVRAVRNVEKAMGNGRKLPDVNELEIARIARRSLVAVRPIRAGEILERAAVGIKRPGSGLSPAALGGLLGCRAVVDIPSGAMLAWEMFAKTRSCV